MQGLSCIYWETFKNVFFEERLRTADSVPDVLQSLLKFLFST